MEKKNSGEKNCTWKRTLSSPKKVVDERAVFGHTRIENTNLPGILLKRLYSSMNENYLVSVVSVYVWHTLVYEQYSTREY